jgi:hypothetical protein
VQYVQYDKNQKTGTISPSSMRRPEDKTCNAYFFSAVSPGAAMKAGVMVGEELLKVDGKDVQGLCLS